MARRKRKQLSPTKGHMSTMQFFNRFPDEAAAREHVERLRWGNSPVCVHCGSERISEVKDEKPQPYRCRDCRKFFSVRTGTIFHGANIGLRECLYAIYLISVSKKGLSSCQLARDLGVTQKTAWYLEHRIRAAYDDAGAMLAGTIEADETFIGGKRKNMSNSKRRELKDTGRGAVGKAAVFGMRERESEQVVACAVETTRAAALQSMIHARVERGSTVYTDESLSYSGLDIGGKHESVRHSISEYVRDQAHTNGIESFWALLKRGYHGTYHHFSVKHLGMYINEFCWRYNRRRMETMVFVNQTVRGTFFKRMGYRRLTQ